MKLNDIYTEEKVRLDPACWHNKKIGNPKTKMKGGVRVNNCVPAESVEEGAIPNLRKYGQQVPSIEAAIDAFSNGDRVFLFPEMDNAPFEAADIETIANYSPEQILVVPCQGVAEEYNPEYDDEAGMAQGSLHTLQNAVAGLQDVIDSGDNLPEWCQEKISLAEDYLVTVWDYIQSEKAQGIDPEIEEMYQAMESLAEEMAHKNRVSVDLVWESFEALPDNVLYETAAWRRKEGKSKSGGLNAKGVASYRRENPGSKLQTAVTTKPSKLKPGSKAAKRRKSFCARMSGVKGPMKKPNGKPTRKALALRKWNC